MNLLRVITIPMKILSTILIACFTTTLLAQEVDRTNYRSSEQLLAERNKRYDIESGWIGYRLTDKEGDAGQEQFYWDRFGCRMIIVTKSIQNIEVTADEWLLTSLVMLDGESQYIGDLQSYIESGEPVSPPRARHVYNKYLADTIVSGMSWTNEKYNMVYEVTELAPKNILGNSALGKRVSNWTLVENKSNYKLNRRKKEMEFDVTMDTTWFITDSHLFKGLLLRSENSFYPGQKTEVDLSTHSVKEAVAIDFDKKFPEELFDKVETELTAEVVLQIVDFLNQ